MRVRVTFRDSLKKNKTHAASGVFASQWFLTISDLLF
jgi:hypothetical protein